ncbi:MAG: CoA transferase [Dehalococcoidales bacterium]|nr:CoA transferase [Dehalococcoidales bacterium]
MLRKPLEGLKVADFSWVLAMPLMTKTLADCGAQVIKIEGKTRPDGERSRHAYKDHIPGLNRATDFNQNNTSKLSFALNLAHPKGKEVAKRLAAWADVVTENFAGGVIAKMGLGYKELKKVNPDIIMLSACMQGQTGPHALHPGYGHHLTALSGFHHLVGWPDRKPQHYDAHTDFLTGNFAILCIMSALDYRNRTGKGLYFDMSQYEMGVQFMSHLILDYEVNGKVAVRDGNRCDFAAPHGNYCCLGDDHWCTIAVFTDKEWHSFCKVIGNPDWTQDAKFSTLLRRKENEDELDKLVEAWTVNYPQEDVMYLMQAAGINAGVAESVEESINDPQLKHSNFFRELEHAEIGKYRSPRPPFQFSKASLEVRTAPLLGENNEYICKEILGMSDDEIAELVIEGVLE